MSVCVGAKLPKNCVETYPKATKIHFPEDKKTQHIDS